MIAENRYKPLFAFAREGIEEVSVMGAYGVFNGREEILNSNPEINIVSRSTLKPLQALNVGPLGSEDHWAMCLASHSGHGYHVKSLRKLQGALGVLDSEILLPESYPLDLSTQAALKLGGCASDKKFHPCYGKHLLYAAKAKEIQSSLSYTHIDHPLNEKLSQAIAKIAPKAGWVYDSCGMPSLSSTIGEYLQIWNKFPHLDQLGSNTIRSLWGKHPNLIGGDGRLDTGIISSTKGLCLAKEGADGILIVQTNDPAMKTPWSILVKVAHGYNASYLGLGLLEILANIQDLPACLVTCKNYLKEKKKAWVPKDQTYLSGFL